MLPILLPLLTPLLNKVLDLIPDPAERARQQAEMMQQLMQAAQQADAAQTQVNQAEAQSGSIFVAGWRPFIGWICGAALAFQYLVRPFSIAISHAIGHPIGDLPGLDDNLWQLILGMLGMGALRTFEKTKGVATGGVGKS